MTLEAALKVIQEKWDKIPLGKSYNEILSKRCLLDGTDIEAVWLSDSDESETYEVNREYIGVTKEGNLLWAYASGCSCWDGDYRIEGHCHVDEFKTLKLNHEKNMNVDWSKKIIELAEKIKHL